MRHIVLVSGVMPDGLAFSPLLWSRRELELMFALCGSSVTVPRPGLLLGPGGTGPRLLVVPADSAWRVGGGA